jgi:drug/metabolite transporter (DMT)-like permease
MRPGSDIFQGASLLVLTASVTLAVAQVLTRKLAAEDARTTLSWTSIVGALITTLILPWAGPLSVRVTAGHAAEILAIGLLAAAGQFLMIRAFQMAPASGIASITYVQIVFATAIGFLGFGSFPDLITLIGMCIILLSGAFLTWHERRLALNASGRALAGQ